MTTSTNFTLLGGGLKDAGWDGANLIPSQLAILPGATHYNIVYRADLLLPVLAPFLDGKQARVSVLQGDL
jgi:hypothetical protein